MDKYSDAEDIIAICPNGTKGKVVSIGGLDIALPAEPPKKTNYGIWTSKQHAVVGKDSYAKGIVSD